MADSEEKWCRLVSEFGRVCERRKLRLNVGKSKVMICPRYGGGSNACNSDSNRFRLWIVLSTCGRKWQLMEDVKEMWYTMNEGYRWWEALKSVLSNRGVGIKAKKCPYKEVIVPTALYGAEAWGMRSAERRKVNVLEIKCLRSFVGVLRMDRVRNEEVRRRAAIEREFASRADQRVLRWFGYVKRRDEYLWKEGVDGGVSRLVRGRPKLRWMDGAKVAIGIRGMAVETARQCAKDRKEGRLIDFHASIFAWPCVVSDRPPVLWWNVVT